MSIVGSTSSGNVVENDYIGTDYAGTSPIPNEDDGVDIEGAPGNRIGDTVNGPTLISGNISNGIEIDGSTASGEFDH